MKNKRIPGNYIYIYIYERAQIPSSKIWIFYLFSKEIILEYNFSLLQIGTNFKSTNHHDQEIDN